MPPKRRRTRRGKKQVLPSQEPVAPASTSDPEELPPLTVVEEDSMDSSAFENGV